MQVRSHAELARLTAEEESARIEAVVARAIAKWLPLGQPLIARLARNEGARLQALLARFLQGERARPSFAVRSVEDMPAADRPWPASLAALGVTLRPDRIDLLPDGSLLVIDYKTGATLPHKKELYGPRPRAPQLPLYATLIDAGGIAFVQLNAGPVTWLGVGEKAWQLAGVVPPVEFTRREVADWPTLRAQWAGALGRLADEIVRGSFAIDRWRRDEASGQWAMATRVHELDPEDDGEEAA
jgi:hypothetical protein